MILILIIYTVLILQLTRAEQSLQCGDWNMFKDELCYKVFDTKGLQSYSDAKNTCYQNEGSSLVTISSREEQDFLYELIHTKHKNENDVWIGGQYTEKLFAWTDNTTVNFTNWANDNPRNDSGYDCVKMSIPEPYHGKWFNEPCSINLLVVCQKTQNWLFSYLQKNVLELRKTFESTIKELENTVKNLQEDIKRATPPGTIAYFTNTTVPLGWLKANGQTVSRTTYANLFASIGTVFGSGDGSTTFTLPDLRGEFIRGWSDGRDVDYDRVFASFQWGSSIPFPSHIDGTSEIASATGWHQNKYFSASTFDSGFVVTIPPGETRNGLIFPAGEPLAYIDTTKTGKASTWTALQGTRPRNIALLACIKH